MGIKKFDAYINNHIKENKWLYLLSLLCICTGIVLGIYSVNYMDDILKKQLCAYISNFSSANDKISNMNVFVESLKNNIPFILLIWFTGLTIIGVPFILIIQLIKGFTLGFTFSFFVNAFRSKGILFSLFGILPQNLIFVGLMIFTSVVAMNFSLALLKEKNAWRVNVIKKINKYTRNLIVILLLMCVGAFIESFVSSYLLKLIKL
ncbi:stage II sporulation protein M [Clostridium cellulovorans]|uniref:Stage II sporulation protein M n=1 Tax=Clostridium cellulovorans (strain ATCC 35296 / DSM 3052 / OCM 3 / 743B) TaxID=573061 RepID=D9SM51_CLOC7|nr:stage II sporulation protein M [Clostridium cellulovorans]ADL51782.1 stage II sporulation protein M [Clostridium cellulovorans 743B]